MVSADPADSGVVASPESDPSEGPCDAAVDPVDSGAAVATDCDSDSVSGACVDSVDPAACGAVDSCDSVAAGGTPEPSVDPVSTASGADSVVGAPVSSDPTVLTEADCVVAESSASVGSDDVSDVSVDEAVALADDDDPSDSVAVGSDVVNAPEGASVSEAPAPDSVTETDSEGAEDSVVAAGSAEGDASSSDVLVSSCGVATVTAGSPLDSDSDPDSDPDPSISAEESVVSGADVDDGLEVLATVSSSSVEGAPVKGPPNSMVGLAVAGGCVWISKSIPSVPDSDCDCDSVEGDSGLLGDGDGDDSDPASGASVASTDT